MADVLSQNEIDALLSAITTGELDADEIKQEAHVIKDYDFTRPSKFSREHLKTLEIIYDNYARIISSYFSGFLRMSSHVQVDNVEALTYKEFSGGLSNPLIFALVNFKPLKGSIIVKFSAKLAYAMIDRVLGGEGGILKKDRDFTEIEIALIQKIMMKLSELMKDPWANVYDIRPSLEKMETNVQFAEVIEPNEMVALVTVNIRIGDLDDMMNICIPHMLIEPIIDNINTKQWFSVKREEHMMDNYKDKIENKLEKVKIPIRAILGRSSITVNEFMDLQVGDVIKLDSDVKEELKILVGNITKFTARPGVCRKRNSILIENVLREEEYNG